MSESTEASTWASVPCRSSQSEQRDKSRKKRKQSPARAMAPPCDPDVAIPSSSLLSACLVHSMLAQTCWPKSHEPCPELPCLVLSCYCTAGESICKPSPFKHLVQAAGDGQRHIFPAVLSPAPIPPPSVCSAVNDSRWVFCLPPDNRHHLPHDIIFQPTHKEPDEMNELNKRYPRGTFFMSQRIKNSLCLQLDTCFLPLSVTLPSTCLLFG